MLKSQIKFKNLSILSLILLVFFPSVLKFCCYVHTYLELLCLSNELPLYHYKISLFIFCSFFFVTSLSSDNNIVIEFSYAYCLVMCPFTFILIVFLILMYIFRALSLLPKQSLSTVSGFSP